MEKEKINFLGALIFMSLFLVLSSSLASAELTPPLPGAPTYVDIGVEKAYQTLEENPEEIVLLDVRTEGEYNDEYIPGAINIPKDVLENRIGELNKSKTIIVYCKSGSRSRTASETLAQHGFENVYNMIGGINAWEEKFATSASTPMPTVTETQAFSPTPTLSPALTPTPVVSPTPEKKQIPGFEVPITIAAIVLIACFMWEVKRKEKR